MRHLSICMWAGLVLCHPRVAACQQVEVDVSAVPAVYKILVSLRNGEPKGRVSAMLDSVLATRAYRTMFRHYNRSWRPNHLPEALFKGMILSLQYPTEYSVGENERADQMLPLWQRFYHDLDGYAANLRQLDQTDFQRLVDDGVRRAQAWLPSGWTIPAFYLPIVPNGGSPAFSIDTAQGYDFFQLPRDSAGRIVWEQLGSTIAHESHHLALKADLPGPMARSDSVAYEFLSLFLGEGTATKFVNAFPGGCVPSVDRTRRDPTYTNAVHEWWARYTAQEPDLFARLASTIEAAYSGAMPRDSLQSEIGAFWLKGFVSPVYFVGAELFGAVYYGFGKDGAFAVMRDLRRLLPMYNDAVRKRPDILGTCPVIPDSTVRHAAGLGRR